MNRWHAYADKPADTLMDAGKELQPVEFLCERCPRIRRVGP